MQTNSETPDTVDIMLDDYSNLFASATPVRGKYYERAMREKGFVKLEPELMQAFPNNGEVNAALRGLVDAAKHVHLNLTTA